MRDFERQSLTKQLMNAIISRIESGELATGAKLPPEAELAESFHVSRNSLRGALKTLDTFGIIESLHGQGTFVSQNAIQRIPNIEVLHLLSDNDDLQSLLDARLVLEPGIARLAATRRTDKDIDKLSESLETFVSDSHGLSAMFHTRVSEAANSPVLHGYLQTIFQKIIHTPYPLLQEKLLPELRDDEVREHREILEAIIDRDENEAQELMYMHLKRRFKLLSGKDKS